MKIEMKLKAELEVKVDLEVDVQVEVVEVVHFSFLKMGFMLYLLFLSFFLLILYSNLTIDCDFDPDINRDIDNVEC